MYLVFFDESGKLDRVAENHSLYGGLGCTREVYDDISAYIAAHSWTKELHFRDFKLRHIDRYLDAINYTLSKDIAMNAIIVSRDDVLETAAKLKLEICRMRELFYIKIPERMIYGILRHLPDYKTIRIIYDRCSEYESYKLNQNAGHRAPHC